MLAANKHPNSKVSKLIREITDDPSRKNVVLLLMELAEHSEYATDFNISLKYVSIYKILVINCGLDNLVMLEKIHIADLKSKIFEILIMNLNSDTL